MPAFLETPRFPDEIAYWAKGGPMYNTTIVTVNSGYEFSNVNWQQSRGRWDVSPGMQDSTRVPTAIAFFRTVKGRGYGFRFKDFNDFDANVGGTGILSDLLTATTNTGNGNGTPTLQLFKNYASGAFTENRAIRKPVAASPAVAIFKGGVLQTPGVGAGQYALDTTTGQVTFVAYASSAASAITPGVNTSVTLAANPNSLIAGQKLYLTGFTGADAALVNSLAHTILGVSGAGPYVFTLSTNTAGKTITVGAGAGAAYPQPADVMTWTGQFDVPCRFDTDRMVGGPTGSMDGGGGGLYQWDGISITEIRV